MVGDGPVVAGDDRRAGVDLGEQAGQGAGDPWLAGPVQGDGDGVGGVGDDAAEAAQDGFAGDGPVFVVVVQVDVEVVGEVLFGVGGQQPQDQLQEPAAGAQQGPLRAGAQLVAGDLGGHGLQGRGRGGQVTLAGGDLLVGGGDQPRVLVGRGDGGVGEHLGQAGLGGGGGLLGLAGLRAGGVAGRAGVVGQAGGVVGEGVDAVVGGVVFEEVLDDPP